jgi:hypothetical protein
MAKRSKKRCEELPVLHPDAAGIDVGASELFVAVSADRDPHRFVVSQPSLAISITCGLATAVRDSLSGNWGLAHY